MHNKSPDHHLYSVSSPAIATFPKGAQSSPGHHWYGVSSPTTAPFPSSPEDLLLTRRAAAGAARAADLRWRSLSFPAPAGAVGSSAGAAASSLAPVLAASVPGQAVQ